MKIKDVFSEVITGFNTTNSTGKADYAKVCKILQKDSIQYTNIIESKLIDKAFTNEIKSKYFLQGRDIIIFVKKPYRVGTYSKSDESDIVVPNNFIILRGINMDKYSYIFVANYLEKIGIKKYIEKHPYIDNLSKEYIKDIDLPDIEKNKQMTISPLLKAINERSAIYSNILENDYKIANYALHSIIGDEDDK